MLDRKKLSLLIKQTATQLGFTHCGIAQAVQLDEDARRLESWLQKGLHGEMQYMERHFDLRIDPAKLVPGAKSVITLLLNYYTEAQQPAGSPKISKYAFGEDYHTVIRARLNRFVAELKTAVGDFNGRGFTDSAPVLERTWAQRSGLGWVGKNGNLINRQSGSYLFIATLITDLEPEPDAPFAADYCGTCNRCVEACPTQAILPGKTINGSQCIAYFTIELKAELLPENMKGKFENWFFGCDICQEVCPWNRFAQPHTEVAFTPLPEILNFTTNEWESLTEEAFARLFRHSPIKRTKHKGLMRNFKFIR